MSQWRYIYSKIFVLVVCASGVWACVRDGSKLVQLAERLGLPEERWRTIPALLRDVELALSTRWPDARAELFGSTLSGLAHRDSDVDLYLAQTEGAAGPADLHQVQTILAQHPDLFSGFHLICNATVPILTFQHIPTGFNVDLNMKTSEGVVNSKLIRYLLGSGCKKHLTLLLKRWAALHQVSGRGLLPSYGMSQLVVFYLQQKHILPPISLLQENAKPLYVDNWNMGFEEIAYKSENNETLYELLGGFFEFYADFDFVEDIVSTFVAHPVKRRLFENSRTVPEEFSLYVRNVESNVTKPLDVTRSACIQGAFHHNKNLGKRLDASPESQFRTQVKRAMRKYRDNDESAFLQQILSET